MTDDVSQEQSQEVQSQGFSQSSIFQEFIDKNQIQNIEFKYCFISQKVLEIQNRSGYLELTL
jgi:hypothetical protein